MKLYVEAASEALSPWRFSPRRLKWVCRRWGRDGLPVWAPGAQVDKGNLLGGAKRQVGCGSQISALSVSLDSRPGGRVVPACVDSRANPREFLRDVQ